MIGNFFACIDEIEVKLVVRSEVMERKNIIQQRDHIILPHATLKRFVDKNKQIYYLDLNDMASISVKNAYPKSYHAIANYYNPEYDDKVKLQETSIGRLHKFFLMIFRGL